MKPTLGFGSGDFNLIGSKAPKKSELRNNVQAELLNMSTDNLMRQHYSKFLIGGDTNQSSNLNLLQEQRNHFKSSSLSGPGKFPPDTFLKTHSQQRDLHLNIGSIGKHKIFIGKPDQGSTRLPSIFENYLKTNPINSQSGDTHQQATKETRISLIEQSSVLDLTKEQQEALLQPFTDHVFNAVKQKYLATSLRKIAKARTSNTSIEVHPLYDQSKQSYLDKQSAINETNEEQIQQQYHSESHDEASFKQPLEQNPSSQSQVPLQIRPHEGLKIAKTSAHKWNLLKNLDFLEDEADANDFDLQIPKFDPVCFCNTGSSKEICYAHDNINGMVNLINDQLKQVNELNINVEDEYNYLDNSLKRIVFLRGHTFYDQIMSILAERDLEIIELKSELSRYMIMKNDNEILRMQLAQMEDDQQYMKEKIIERKQHMNMIDKLENLVKELKLQLSGKENHNHELQSLVSQLKTQSAKLKKELKEEKQKTAVMQDKIEQCEQQIRKLQKQNANLSQFISGVVDELDFKDKDLVDKGKKLIEMNLRLNNTNVVQENFEHLEKEVKSLSVMRYLAEAAVDVRKGGDPNSPRLSSYNE